MLSRNRVDEGEVWTGASSFESDSWRRTLMGETYQMPMIQSMQRSKRQNCGTLVQGQLNNMNGIYGSKDHLLPGAERMNQEVEASLAHCPGPVFSGLHAVMDQSNRKAHYNFFLNGSSGPGSSSSSNLLPNLRAGNGRLETLMENNNALLEDMVAICNPASALQSARCAELGPMTTYWNADGPGSLSGNVVEHIGCVEAPFSRVIFNQGHNILEGGSSIPSMCMTSSLLPDEEAARFSISSMNDPDSSSANTSRGRRNSCKRKNSMAEISGCLPFRGSYSCGRWDGNFSRSIEGSGPGRFDTGNSMCADYDVFQSTNSDHMIPLWDKPQYFRDGDNGLQCLRANLAFNGPAESSGRYPGSRPICVERGQSQSQLNPLFMRNGRRMLASVPSQSWMSRRILMNNQVVESPPNANNTVVPDVENQSVLVYNQSSTSPVASNWCVNNTYPGAHMDYSVFTGAVREILPGTLEGNLMRNSSTGASNWLGVTTIDGSFPNQSTFDPPGRAFSGMTNRGLHARESHVSHVSVNPFVYPGSVAPRSSAHLAVVASNRRNSFHSQGRLLSRTASAASNSLPQAVSANSYPFPESLHGPYPPAMPSLFLPGGGALASSMHNLLRMPFRGVQILPAEGGNRQRFVSEELLDQSLYNGVDIHDQHSDMRLDVDNMSYEELLALEERIGNVNTGLTDDIITKCLKTSKHSSSDVTVNAVSQESEIKCSICQEEYSEEDELGKLDCGHSYHTACIKQWLVQKNQCPICKATAYAES